MVVKKSVIKMPASRHSSRIDTMELKLRIESKIGQQKAEKYFNLLSRYLSLKVGKSEFNKLCIDLIGRENIRIHNELIRAIITNATFSKTPPPKPSKPKGPLSVKVPNGLQQSSLQSLCRDVFPQSPRKGRTPNLRERRFKDRPSPLGPHGKTHSVTFEDLTTKGQEHQSDKELVSLGNRLVAEVISVEEGDEFEQASKSPEIHSRSPIRAPLGISIHTKQTQKVLRNGITLTCYNSGELPDTNSLKNRLDQKMEMEGLKISTDCVNLLNNGLDIFLKSLIKPTLQLSDSRYKHNHLNQVNYQAASGLNGMRPMGYIQKQHRSVSASMLDFRVAMESNPRILGGDWPVQLENVSSHASENYS